MGVERYELKRQLQRGAMSDVWLAYDRQTRKMVAFKIMKSIEQDEKRNLKTEERFKREIEIAQHLNHPQIIPVLDHGYMEYEQRHVPFLVSRYMPEGSLVDLINQRPPWTHWTLVQTVDVIVQAADCLWYLHTRNPPIVHEDVKPGNFLYETVHSEERIVRLYLCDFGISRRKLPSYSMASEVLGTLEFIAPEQLNRTVDPASDQYALAVMACFLLTGKLPIQVASRDAYRQAHRYGHPRLPGELNANRIQSEEVDAIFAKALAKDPADRYPTIIDFALKLQQAIGNYVYGPTYDLEPDSTPYAPTVAVDKDGKPIVPALKTQIAIMLDPLDTSDGAVLDEPLPVSPAKKAQHLLKEEQKAYDPVALREIMRIKLPMRPRMLQWAQQVPEIACVFLGHAPIVLSLDGGQRAITTANAQTAQHLAWSVDSSVVAVGSSNEVRFWNVQTQTVCPLHLRFPGQTIEALDWSSREQLAIWFTNHILVYTLPVAALLSSHATSTQRIATGTLRGNSRGLGVLRWSPDGEMLAAGAMNGEVICWEIGTSVQQWRVSALGKKVNSVCWSPDSKLLAVAFQDFRVVVWQRATRDIYSRWEKLPAMPRMISISAQQQLTIASSEQRLLVGQQQLAGFIPGQLLACWSPIANYLATLDETDERILVIWSQE